MINTEEWAGRCGSKGVYRIRVRGELDASWSDRLGGMSITVTREKGKQPVSSLEGKLRDQSALAGVLDTLYELHLPILKVEALDPKGP